MWLSADSVDCIDRVLRAEACIEAHIIVRWKQLMHLYLIWNPVISLDFWFSIHSRTFINKLFSIKNIPHSIKISDVCNDMEFISKLQFWVWQLCQMGAAVNSNSETDTSILKEWDILDSPTFQWTSFARVPFNLGWCKISNDTCLMTNRELVSQKSCKHQHHSKLSRKSHIATVAACCEQTGCWILYITTQISLSEILWDSRGWKRMQLFLCFSFHGFYD